MNIADQALHMSKADLAALIAFASNDTTRKNLNGISIDRHAGRVFATDGHRALVWKPETLPEAGLGGSDTPHRFVLPLEVMQTIYKAVARKFPLVLTFGATSAQVRYGVTVFTVDYARDYNDKELALPPQVQCVIPERSPTAACAVTAVCAAYLADLELVTKAIESRSGGVLIQAGANDLEPILFRFANGPEWLAVIMPTREHGTNKVPSLSEESWTRLRETEFAQHVHRLALLEPADLRDVGQLIWDGAMRADRNRQAKEAAESTPEGRRAKLRAV